MKITVFYSWQSDLPNKYNRSFIEECIREAIKSLNNSGEYDLEVRLDKDTQGTTGTPDIANTIFQKIRKSHVFVGDVSIINPKTSERKCPNPNVLLEMGHAAASLGWENVIAVFNGGEAKVEDLPFDLRLRRPLIYTLGDANADQKVAQKKFLVSALRDAITNLHPEMIETRRTLEKAFQDEPKHILELALEKPKYWEIKLTEAILRDRLSRATKRNRDFKSGLLYGKSRYLSTDEFLTFCQTSPQYLIGMVQTLLNSFKHEFPDSQGPPGKPGDPFKIRDFANRVATVANNMLDWEIDTASIIVPEKCKDLHAGLCGVSEQMFEEIVTLPDRLKATFDMDLDAGGTITVNMTFQGTQKLNDLFEKIHYYSANPHELF